MKKTLCIAALALTAWTASSQSQIKTLKDAYKDYFSIGVAINMGNIISTEHALQIKQMYNSITAENDMKPINTQPEEGVWNWSNANNIANFARINNIPLRGHTLIWHGQTGRWMFYDDKGKLVKKEVLFERMRTHINTVMNRYKGQAYAWDVVNEAISDDPNAEHPYRESLYYQICGSDEFIRKAFEFAREADPDALLFYNDYNDTNPMKRERIYNMVREMRAAGVPIDGIGMQGHYNINSPSETDFRAALERYSEVVDHIHITELDVRVNAGMGGQMEGEQGRNELTPELESRQVDQYDMLFRVMREHKDVIDNVTFWNTDDAHTWLDGRSGSSGRSFPLLFDDNLQPKAAYYRVINF
ncbi:MAG: endo-1,4-beta-xylanase [Bacteroidales bacterium]|jgi:GH35 family endo-1,4-beta-xylanase|nr:endo-1,4-beta-xylanase [Bacteroidales bacterium]